MGEKNNNELIFNIVIPLGSIFIGVIAGFLFKLNISEGTVVSLISYIITNQILQYSINKKAEKAHEDSLEKINEVVLLTTSRKKTIETKHTYFRDALQTIEASFKSKFKALAEGKYYTKFNADESLMPEDLQQDINKYDDVKIISLVNPEFNTFLPPNYLTTEIKNKKLKIIRILIFSSEAEKNEYMDDMDKQCAAGVCVYFMLSTEHNEDYIIIDDELLIQQIINSGAKSKDKYQQLVTVDEAEVNVKKKQFNRLITRAEPHCSKCKDAKEHEL